VLIVHDRDDRAAPLAAAQALADALPAARLHITEGLSHRRVLSDPSVLATVLAHLGRPNTSAL
jgi:pimeloyl-ACP methyl ester carboxylesterase